MSDKPKGHPMLRHEVHTEGYPLEITYVNEDTPVGPLTPDEAVALGYALFELGLYLKGRMKP